MWLLVNLFLGIQNARSGGFNWGLSDVVCCAGYFLVLTAVAGLALGHLALMWIVGWRGDNV